MTNNSEPEVAPKDPSGHVFDNGAGDTKQPSEDAGHNNKKMEVTDTTNPAAVTASASTAASSAPSAQEIASGTVVGGGDADGDSTTYSNVKMPPSALRPNKTRRYSGTSEDFAGSASNTKGEDELPDTAAAVAIAANRISGLSEHSYSATSHSSRRSSGAGSDTSSRRASVSSNQSDRRGSGLFARMQRRSSNEGSLPSLQSSRRNSDVDDTRSRRSSTSRVSRRTSALLSWGK